MFDKKTVSIEWGGKTLTLETGQIARQADGAVLATYGETVVLCAVTAAKSVREGQDFFPLTVHYQEKFSAAGRIPGGFFKREGRATEKETLTSRLIDRPVRPLFPEGFYNEINVICQVMSYDGETEPDIVAMVAASAALTISGLPFMGPIGAARVGFSNDGEYILNPTISDALGEDGRLDLVVAATNDAVMMVESEVSEMTEDEMNLFLCLKNQILFSTPKNKPTRLFLVTYAVVRPIYNAPSSTICCANGMMRIRSVLPLSLKPCKMWRHHS